VTNVVIHNQGVPQLVRTVARGGDELTSVVASRLSTDTDGAELAKRTAGLADPKSPVYEAIIEALRPLLSELRSSIRLFEQTHPDALVERITLTGGGAGLPGLVDLLAETTEIPVEAAAALRHVGSHRAAKPAESEDPNRAASAVCVGLAMGAAA
jgi:type IV pilus assembly protein PilM